MVYKENTVFLNIKRLYREGMSPAELYEITRRAWRMSAARHTHIKLAVGVVDGKVKSAYRVDSWQACGEPFSGRWEFTRLENADVTSYINQSAAAFMPRGARFVVRYNFFC